MPRAKWGGITTDTSAAAENKTKIGGFIGAYVNYSDEANGYQGNPGNSMLQPLSKGNNTLTLINCYYDMQTTAMRERDAGYFSAEQGVLTGTLSGLKGVYTQSSAIEGPEYVDGLTDTVDMNKGLLEDEESAWTNSSNQYYPQLLVFTEEPERNSYPEGLAGDMQYDRQLKYYYCSLASTATVFLDHYDYMLDEAGDEVPADAETYDTVRDITRKFVFTTDDGKGIAWTNDNSVGSKNYRDGFVDKLGKTDVDSTEETGFSLSYDSDGNGTDDITSKFSPNVLVIGEYGGVYKCLDFAPGKQWVKVTATDVSADGETASENGSMVTGTRRLRLLPTAYLNAGSILHINIVTDSDGTVSNTVSYTNTTAEGSNEVQLPGSFNHSVGVAYAITDKERMSNTDVYAGQKLTAYEGSTGTDNTTFAFYSEYSVTDSSSRNLIGKNSDDGTAITGMLDQKFTVKYSSTGMLNLSYGGTTKVKIYHAAIDDATNELEKKAEILYTADDIAKWQGQEPFTTADTGYYYLDYYWRLDDGRYLTDSKLVRISADSYNVQMITGLLEQEHTVDEEKFGAEKTAVDQYVAEVIYDTKNDTYSWYRNSTAELYPSRDSSFSEETASEYYDTYNEAEIYNGNNYYTKSVHISTNNEMTVVGWKRTTDYKLTTLIIEAIDANNEPHVMARVDNLDTEKFTFDNAKYAYNYKIYSVTQDPETKLFSIATQESVPIEFSVVAVGDDIASGIDRYIVFDFNSGIDDTEQKATYASITDNLRVTALFRENTANVMGTKSVLLKPEDAADEAEKITEKRLVAVEHENGETSYEEQDYTYYNSLAEADSKYEVDNSGLSADKSADDHLRKAVLGGDTLTYRVKLENLGFFESDVVNVYDTLPDNCTFVPGSMKIYRQKLDLLNSLNEYEQTELVAWQESDADGNWVSSGLSGYELISPTAESGNMQWILPSLALDYEYYVQYEVTVNDLPANELSRLLTNTATWDFRCRNGDVTEDFPAGNLQELKDAEIFTLTMELNEEKGQPDTEFRTYKIEFAQKDPDRTYDNIVFTNNFPGSGFSYKDDSIEIFKWDSASGDYVKVEDVTYLTSENEGSADDGLTVIYKDAYFVVQGFDIRGPEDKYLVTFKGKQVMLGEADSDGNIVTEISNKASVIYQAEDGNTEGNSIALTERISNEVSTDVTHLYLNIEKQIDVKTGDASQSFLMKITYYEDEEAAEAGQAGEVFYTRINCTEPVTDGDGTIVGYRGNRLVQCDKRGIYITEEVIGWSETDYSFGSAAARDSVTGNDGKAVYPDGAFVNGAVSAEAEQVTTVFPRVMYLSGAFPTALGTDFSAAPAAVFNNAESEYAYLSGQSYAENIFSDQSSVAGPETGGDTN